MAENLRGDVEGKRLRSGKIRYEERAEFTEMGKVATDTNILYLRTR